MSDPMQNDATGRVCSIDDCERTSYARTWCRLHYHRWRRQGDPLKVIPASERPHPTRAGR
jgi:hypothetical protein